MAKHQRNSATEEVKMKNGNKEEMIRGVSEEVKMKNCTVRKSTIEETKMKNGKKGEVMMKNDNKEEVIRGVTEEVRGVSSVTYDLTLVCKGGATVRKIHQNHSLVILSPSS